MVVSLWASCGLRLFRELIAGAVAVFASITGVVTSCRRLEGRSFHHIAGVGTGAAVQSQAQLQPDELLNYSSLAFCLQPPTKRVGVRFLQTDALFDPELSIE